MRLMAAFLLSLTLAGAAQAQGLPECTTEFTFGSFDTGPIDLSPPAGQLPPQLDANGISLIFDSYVAEINGNPMMGSAFLDIAPDGIDSPNALLLTTTKAVFLWTAISLGIADPVTEVAFQVVDAGTGLPINLSVNGESTWVGMVDMIPPDLPGGIAVDVQGTPEVEGLYTIALSGGGTAIERVEVGGTLAMGDLCLVTGDPNGGGDNGNGGDPCSTGPSFAVEVTMNTDNYPGETTWALTDADGTTVLSGGPYNEAFSTFTASASLCAGCYTLSVLDGFGDGMCCLQGEGGFTVTIEGELVAEGGEFSDATTVEVCTPAGDVLGCTYPVALNYDSLATDDDGSCVFDVIVPCDVDSDGDGVCDEDEVPGCTDPCSCSFNVDATDDDGSCVLADALGDCGGFCIADLDEDGECDDEDCCVGAYDECGICNGPGAIFDCGCNALPAGACDCEGSQPDALGECGGDCPADLDSDGICDNVDDCVGDYDNCGICNGPGAVFSCGCFSLPATDCDCEGNQLDALGICGGGCPGDIDGDGICDTEEIPGCTDAAACNYAPNATDDDGSCEFPTAGFDCDSDCLNDQDGDGVCDSDEIYGCTDQTACNYDPSATENVGCLYATFGYDCFGQCLGDADGDGICDAYEVAGCTDSMACNFLPEATDDDGSCAYAGTVYDCDGNCLSDVNGNGICDALEEFGCMDPTACNYNPLATTPDPNASCLYASFGYDCFGQCLDDDGDGICNVDETGGCTYSEASNYDPTATQDDGSCTFPDGGSNDCPDLDGDGVVAISDLLTLLGAFGDTVDC